jgi:signal transduction histidine kinase/CheY-like chemotaxis protein
MNPASPVPSRVRDVALLAAALTLIGAGIGSIALDRSRSLATAARESALIANAAGTYARLGVDTAMRQLDEVAAAAGGDGSPARLAEAARCALAGVPDASYVAVTDARGQVVATAGQVDPLQVQAEAARMLSGPPETGPDGPAWHFGGAGTLLIGRRLDPAAGGTGGAALLAMGAGWMEAFAAGLDPGGQSDILLTGADRQVILRLFSPAGSPAPPPGAGFAGQLVEMRSVVADQLQMAVVVGQNATLAAWRGRVANELLLPAGLLALLFAGGLRLRGHLLRLKAANTHRVRQLAQLATASERLSRLRDVDKIVTRAETIGRTLLACERIAITCGGAGETAADLAPDAGSERRGINLLSAGGETLGRITLIRAAGDPFTAEDDLVLEHFARAVGSALEGATLLADTMRSKFELELILSTISDGMFVLSHDWNVRYVNAAASNYLHRPREEMLGMSVWTLFPGMHDGDMGERLEAAAAQGLDAEFTTFHAPLSAWFDVRAYPYAGGLTVYFRDVTFQRETEDKLRQGQKLEAIGQLTGGIAHDVNNLLTVILGNLEMLAMRAEDRINGVPEPPEDEPGLDLTLAEAGLRAGESASQLMHRLLAFSRIQPLSPQAVAVGALLQSLQPLLRRTLSEQVTLRMHWPADLWHALIDPSELESAILNLTINAQDAMPGGGLLTIEATNVAIDRVYAASAGMDRPGDYIMVSVSDTGCGMKKDVSARAFDPFFTTKAPGKGTGLGLSMVYGFVRQSGGHVLIDSEPGQGTMLRMYLPRTNPPDSVDATAAREGAAGGSETILLVEDNDLVRAHTEAMLRGLGYAVVATADGPSALKALADGLCPDLLLTDVILHGSMTGRDVADAAQHRLPGLRVLFISGYSGTVLLENGGLPPGVDLLGKPFRRSELATRIRAQLAGPPAAGPSSTLAPAASEPG